MKATYQKVLSKYGQFTPEEIDGLIENTLLSTYKKGSIILKQGAVSDMCYFVVEGCVRQHQLIDGEEKTIDFYLDKEAVISYSSYLENAPSAYSLSCVEDSILIGGSKQQEVLLLKQYPQLKSLTQLFMRADFTKLQDRLASFVTLSPEERYRTILNNQPALLNRVPLQYLASYIGVTPESFSRIRKRVITQERKMS